MQISRHARFIGLRMIPGANWFFCPTTLQTVLGKSGELTRFITTVPTAIMPSRLERFDSKYIARAMQASCAPLGPLTLSDVSASSFLNMEQPDNTESAAKILIAVFMRGLVSVILVKPIRFRIVGAL